MSEFREMMEQREQSQACLNSAERQNSTFRQMRRKRQQLSNEESLQKEIESGFSRMLMIRLDIEHLTGKEAIELAKQR